MYPFKIVLVGCDGSGRAQVRQGLVNQLAAVACEYPDVESALRGAQPAGGEQHLYIVHVRSTADLLPLKRLADGLGDQPILGLRDAAGDAAVFTGAMRAGAAFVVSLPLEGEDLGIALTWIAKQYGHKVSTTKTIAVSGVTGGCGATTLALNLAVELAHLRHLRCIIAELALKMGVLATYLNVEVKHSLNDLLADADNLDIDMVRKALVPAAKNVGALCGPQQAIQAGTVTWAQFSRVLPYLRPLADVVLLDVPCTYDDLQFDALAAADYVVLVAEQKIPSIRALQMVRQAILQRNPAAEIHIVINRYDARIKGFTTPDLQVLLHVPRLLTVASDLAAVDEAINQGCTLRVQAPGSRALADIGALARQLPSEPGTAKAPAEEPNLFGRLVRAFGLTSGVRS